MLIMAALQSNDVIPLMLSISSSSFADMLNQLTIRKVGCSMQVKSHGKLMKLYFLVSV